MNSKIIYGWLVLGMSIVVALESRHLYGRHLWPKDSQELLTDGIGMLLMGIAAILLGFGMDERRKK